MDYQKIYNQIITKAKNRYIDGYIEYHHVIPKCLGGDNSKENLVVLTAREHFICHQLLCEIYPNESKLKHALFLMSTGKQKKKDKQYKISSRTYQRLKLEYSLFLTGKKQSKQTCDKKSKSMVEVWKYKTEEEMSIIGYKRSQALIGRDITWGKDISEALIGRKTPWLTKPISQYTLEGVWVRDWESVAEISKHSDYGFVGACVSGKQKTAYGYIWKHKK
jgi:hypothetical protein